MRGVDYVLSHGSADMALLLELWAQGVSAAEIASRFGVKRGTISKWAKRYGLPPRAALATPEYEAPSPEDDAASLDGLALSPWVESRARECREAHYAQRRGEGEETVRTKLWRWGRGDYDSQGART